MCLLPTIGLPLSYDLTSQLRDEQLGSRHHGHLAGCGVSCWHGGEFALFNLPAAYLQRQGERVQVWQLLTDFSLRLHLMAFLSFDYAAIPCHEIRSSVHCS